MQNNITGALYIVATPIGNLKDISIRALEILREVDLIAAEDTRHSKRLLQHYGIETPMLSLYDFNEKRRAKVLLEKLAQGEKIALISDAGTPLISDPGYYLVTQAHSAGNKIIPIPGACAAIAALSASGLPTDSFLFAGFLPHKMAAAKKKLEDLQFEARTLIFYESPHRILATIDGMLEVFGAERIAVIAKELTKMFETIYSASLGEIKKWLAAESERQKGEFVVLVHGVESKKGADVDELSHEEKKVLKILLSELPPKLASKLTAKITGANVKKLYNFAVQM